MSNQSREIIMKTITLNTMSLTVTNDVFERWDTILCDNPFNYAKCFSMHVEGDTFLVADDINNLIEIARVSNVDVNREVMVNGVGTSCADLIAFCVYAADLGATWDSDTIITDASDFDMNPSDHSVDPFDVSNPDVHIIHDDDEIPF